MATGTKRLIVAVTGASGAVYGLRSLELLAGIEAVETHLVVSRGARETIRAELGRGASALTDLADQVHSDGNLGASIASGSFPVDGMLVAPCSIKTLSGIATSYADNLIVRAADVTLKERRPLVLLVRETPLHPGHLRLMSDAADAGAIIMPPVPAFYTLPRSLDDVVDHTVGRALDLFGIATGSVRRWTGQAVASQPTDPAAGPIPLE